MNPEQEAAVKRLKEKTDALRCALITALSWMGGSANTPLSHSEIAEIIQRMQVRFGDLDESR